MTADQVGKAMPDDLLSSDTSAIQPATSLEPSVHMDPSHVVDQHGQTTLNTSAIVPVLDLGSPANLRSGHVLDLVSVQASHQIVSMETTSTFSTEVKGAEGNIGGSNLTNVSNALDDIRHFGNGGASLSSIQATGHILPEDKDNAARSQSITVNFHCHADDVLESVKDNKATVEPVVSRDLSKTTSTDSPMIPDQNSDLDVLETNHDGENTQHTLKVSNIKDSIQTQDQPQARPVNRDTSAVGNIPDTSFEMNWIPETLQGGMTGVDSVDQANTVCNTDRSNVIKNDPEISGITEETVHNFTLDTSSIGLDTVSYIVSEMDDSAGVCEACEPGSEIGDIVANVTVGSCLSSGEHTHGIDSEISGTVATTDYCNDSEIKEGAGVIVLNTDSDLTIDSTATNQGNPMPTPEMNKVVGETVHNFSFKISGIVQESVCHVDSKICDSTEDNARKLSPKTGDIVGKVKAYCLSSEDCTHSTNCGIVSTTANYTASKIKDSEEVTVPNTDSDLTVVCCSDSKIKGTETVPNISPEKHTIVWDTVSHTDFDISDSVKDIACKSGPEISEIVGDGSGKTESESTLNPAVRNTAEERWHKTEPERINTTAENISDTNSEVRDIIKVTTCQISSEEAETSQSIDAGVGNIIEESHQETACNPDSESGYFFGEFSICSVDFDADCKTNDTVELALPNSDSETNDTKEGGILNSNSDKCDSQRLTLKSSRTNEVIPMPQNDPKIGEIHGEHLEFETTISSTDGDDIHKVMPERSDTTAGRIYDTDSEDRDIVKETTSHIICKKVETSQQTDSGVSNIIEESHLETVCNNVTEKACIFGESQNDPQIGETTISSSDGENISKVMSKRSDTTAVDSEERCIVEETTNHISCKEVETSQHTDSRESNIIDESHLETVCNSETEKACIFGESSICSGDSEDSVGLTVDNTDSEVNYIGKGLQWKAVPNISLEKSGIVQGSVCHIDPEKLDFAEDTACKLDPEIGDIFGEIKVKTTVSDFPTEISHKTEQERSNTTRKNTHDTESEVILEPQKKFAIEMNQPLKVIDSQILRHPSTQPSVVESHDNNVEEGGTIASILDPGMPNQKGMPADSLTDLTFNLLANVMTPPQNLAEESDLDMLSSKSCELEYLVPHSIPLLQLESKAFHSNDPTVDNLSENSPDIHLQIPSFPHTSIGKPQISEETETDPPPQDDTLHLGHPHVALQDLESSYKWVEGEGSGSEVTDARCSKQLWTDADAGPFLAFEENQGSIFDEWGHSPAPSPPRASPDNTKPLAYSHERDTVIGQMVDDWELPPIERWSSSDSWASALSDWFQSVDVYTEDSPLAATTISCSSPVDSLSVPYLSYQDSSEGQKGSPEITSTSGQMCLPLCSGNDNNFNGLEQQLTDTDLNLHNQSYTTGTKDSTGDSAVPKQEMDMELETVKPYGAYRPKHMGSHVQEDTNVPGKFIKDNSKGKAANQQISRTKQDSDAVWGVAENRTSQLFPDFEEENLKNHGPLKFSDYPSNRTPRAGPVCGPCFETHPPPQLGGHVPSELEHLTHAEGAPHCAHSHSCTEGTRSHVSLYTKDSETNQGEGRAGDPLRFIMPFAPIATGTSFCHPKTFISSKPSLIGVTNELRADPTAYSPDKPASGEESSDEQFHTCSEKSCEQTSASSCVESEDSQESTTHKTDLQKARHLGQELSKLILLTGQRFTVSEKKRVAYVTLDLDDPLNFNKDTSLRCDQGVLSCPKHAVNCEEHHLHTKDDSTMPQKAGKTSSEGKARSKHKVDKGDNKMTGPQLGTPSKKQEKVRAEPQVEVENECLGSGDSTVTVIETIVITEKVTPKTQGGQKKKKKPCMAKLESEPLATVENGARPKATNATKAKNQCSEDMPTPKTGKTVKEKPGLPLISMMNMASADGSLKATGINQHKEPEADSKANIAKAGKTPCGQDAQGTCLPKMLEDDVIKRRRLSEVKSEAVPIRTRPQLPAIFRQKKEEDVPFKKAYSDVVKQKIQTPKEAVVVPHVVAEIQAAPVPEDPQSISLWCQFSPVAAESSISWTKEGKILTEMKRGAGDDSRVTLSILKACSKDLGMYRCTLTGSTGTVFSSDYHLTSEVLMELVLPSHDTPVERHRVEGDEESVHCAPLLFRNDILTEQYFGENQSASIVTEKDHFGEGMHRKAFRTTLRAGMEPAFNPGHPCVLKVHNAITYGTKNNEELVQKNYNLAVEECHVQNTAREYIKAYNNAAKSTESFGDVPEIIPIYLVHRPSSDIPYATLEEELIGDFVKYSVKDGKEINLMRRDSEAGQKCCAFQHWVYSQTDGNLLVTDMQGVGMRLTDVGIATCKKGYKGFKGNCATSFIDQFQALHQCNRFCELLGLTSLQPKPKRTVAPPKPKTQPAPKKKTCGPVLKSKS